MIEFLSVNCHRRFGTQLVLDCKMDFWNILGVKQNEQNVGEPQFLFYSLSDYNMRNRSSEF